ncbi:ligand-binding sensor domain-containing protein [Marinicella litoralis]|uniref:diguanylate cyclase n=1 Tax=Marinicella litoralis TaxID=644220 RepID=A0A4R6Y112_9GAMM|nr:ligand-binding sensor domain-containing diguanylate cyclase [Marinicella litoralis]TDR22628.1 diguanylate cyclase (GGDEF)-like protein [Marinicella litoralis]
MTKCSIYTRLPIPTCLAMKTVFFNLKNYLTSVLLLVSWAAISSHSDQWQAVELSMEDGLPDSTVYSMSQDKTGYMWFGTTSGLARYDGYSFKVFRHDGADESTISNNNAGNIYLDSENHLWIGTFGGGANVIDLNNGELTRLPYSSSKTDQMISENVQTFFEDSQHSMWIGTGSGLYQMKGDQLNYFGGKKQDNSGFSQSRVWDIEEDSLGNIWLGTSQGLSQLNVNTGIYQHFKLPASLISNISSNQFRNIQMDEDVLWIGSSTGLYSFDIDTKQFTLHFSNNKTIKINDIHFEAGGKLLIATMEGLYEYDATKQLFKTDEGGELWQAYAHLDVRQILRDRSGLLWLATRDNGVVKIDQAGGLFKLHTNYVSESEATEQNKQVWTINTDEFSNLLIGTSETVYQHPIAAPSSKVVVDGLNEIPGIIRTIKKTKENGFWIGTSAGLFLLPSNSLKAEIKNEPFDLVGIEPTDVFSVTESLNGDLWLALYNIGVLQWNPMTHTAKLMQTVDGQSLTDMNISVIYEDNHQHIWIGSNLAGVFRLDPESQQIELFKHDYGDINSISSNRIKDIFQDSMGRLWIATARGLNQFLPESLNFKQYSQSNGLLSDSIGSIHEDSNQNLWIVYKFGLSRFNPEKEEINNYILNESISNDGFGNRSSTIDANDVIYIGSINGYYSFYPRLIKQSKQYKPPLILSQVWVNNQPVQNAQWVSKQNQFDLYHEDRAISFEFAALDFKAPEQIKYRYRIMGLNEEWLNISSNRMIELSHLNPGAYQIEVKAINNDGRWSEELMSINLNIHPVWWNQGWVRALFGIIFVLLAIFLHQFRTNKIKRQNQTLENEVKSRTSELRDLNAQLKTAAHSDYLTSLPNRMAFIKTIELKRKDPAIDGICLVMADIDHFKQINDQYGHAAGDVILIKVSEIMRAMIREEDMVARWGGEEFIFYFEAKNANQLLPMIDRIREAVEGTEFKYGENIISVTLTFGICQSEKGMSLNDCIKKADEAMYQGKSGGRNTIRIAH